MRYRQSFGLTKAIMALCSLLVIAIITLPLGQMIVQPSIHDLVEVLQDKEVLRSILLSMECAAMAALIALVIGTPFAYLLARNEFPGKKVVESIVDIPIMIPHPIIGIAILGVASPDHVLGRILEKMGIEIMGSVTGIVLVLTFVGLPFYVNTVKNGFEAIPERLENVARSLGASFGSTFLRITLPLGWRAMLAGIIMCMARALSEFGAVIIVAYHPMIAPVLIYERFTAYGLKYSQPVAVILILISLILFVLLRFIGKPGKKRL